MSSTIRIVRLLVALAAFALVAVSCGDDDDGDAVADPTSSTTADDGAGDEGEAPGTDPAAGDDAGDGSGAEPGASPPGDAGAPDEGGGDPLVFVTELSGAAEVPGPGDPGGAGRAEIESDLDGRLCFDMVATGLDAAVVAAHVHEAPAGASGGVVIDIGTPTAVDGDTDSWTDVCVAVDAAVVERMNADPAGFYVNVHTETFGDGAVRGQLEPATIFDLELS